MGVEIKSTAKIYANVGDSGKTKAIRVSVTISKDWRMVNLRKWKGRICSYAACGDLAPPCERTIKESAMEAK